MRRKQCAGSPRRGSGPAAGGVFNSGTVSVVMNFLKALGVGVLFAGVTACSTSSSPVAPTGLSGGSTVLDSGRIAARPDYATAAKPGNMTIVDIVLQDDGEFDVLQAAVIRAGLVDALNSRTQRTVFAPTDAAFVSTLGVADEAAAISAINGLPLETLTDILLYHVTTGRRNSASVLAAPGYQMLNGGTLTQATLLAAGLAATDISASNGIVHVINAVLLP